MTRGFLAAVLLLVPLAAPAQDRILNAKLERHAASRPLDQEVRAVASRGGTAWIGYLAPRVATARGWSECGPRRLEDQNHATAVATTNPVMLEAATTVLVLTRVDEGAVVRVRTFGIDCDIDAGGLPFVWLDAVAPDDSVRYLTSLATRDIPAGGPRDRVGQPAMAALALHAGQAALASLLRLARDDARPAARGRALSWLAERAGREALGAIADAIDRDPETEVKKKAVFALSRLPRDEGVPKLIEVARTNRNPEVRRQAMFWLGQSHDPRAVTFFEQVLSR